MAVYAEQFDTRRIIVRWFPYYVIVGCVKSTSEAYFPQLLVSSHLVFESCLANQFRISPVNLFSEAFAEAVAHQSHISGTIQSLLRFKWARLTIQKSTNPRRTFTPIRKFRGLTSSRIFRTRPRKCPHTELLVQNHPMKEPIKLSLVFQRQRGREKVSPTLILPEL